ncbi:MAG: SRPBCC domain-containing protein [Calditrichaeota bacterium]|nr:MAG: SRPBCC domain-containing protein [Calditrichota bacterium]
MRKDDPPVVVEQTFNTSAEVVWKAITEVDQMRQWFFENIPEFEPKVGFETQFNVNSGERNFLHLWKITAVEPQKLVTYNWKYQDYAGDSFVIFEIMEVNNQAKLKLTTQIIESFSQDIPEFKRESCVAGWTYFINKNLKEYIENLA